MVRYNRGTRTTTIRATILPLDKENSRLPVVREENATEVSLDGKSNWQYEIRNRENKKEEEGKMKIENYVERVVLMASCARDQDNGG